VSLSVTCLFNICPTIGQEEKFNQTYISGYISIAVPRVTVPGTDLNVSRICLGTWQFNDNKGTNAWDAQSEKVRLIIFNN